MGTLRSVNFCYISGLPPTLVRGFVSLYSHKTRTPAQITLIASIHDNPVFSSLRTLLRKTGGNSCGVLFLSYSSRILYHHFGRAHHHRPLTKRRSAARRTLTGRQHVLTPLTTQTSFLISAARLNATRLGRQLYRLFTSATRGPVAVRYVSFNFGCNFPTRTSVVLSIQYFPGPFCIPRLGRRANLSTPIQSFILTSPSARRFLAQLCRLLSRLVPLCVGRKGDRLIITVKYANNGRHSIAIARTLITRVTSANRQILTGRQSVLGEWEERDTYLFLLVWGGD